MPIRGLALTLLTTTVIAAPATALAQPKAPKAPPKDPAADATFESVAAAAAPVDRLGLAGLAWAVTARCDAGDELSRRQCRAIQAIRMRAVEGRTFVVTGDAATVAVGAWDDKKKALPVTVTGCIACADPVVVDDVALYVVAGKGAPGFDGAVARGPVIVETARPFPSQADAETWRAEVAPRLRAELVVRVAAGQAAWDQGGRRGIAVEALAVRVSDPCDGAVVAASPGAARAPVDRAACGEVADPKKPAGGGTTKPAPLPDELDGEAIKRAMAPVRAAAQKCFDTYQVPGDAKLRVTVAEGAVASIEQTGDFVDTPTGACIEKAVREVSFPRTKKARQSFNYPIVLR